ncbi:MAG: M48 family metalloprotease [Armatimonadota bacterium]|nr:M48 family metalloprotease [bacterium]MDW8290041.1 M48 family metalloprotease [Armatimonadota bacterium]
MKRTTVWSAFLLVVSLLLSGLSQGIWAQPKQEEDEEVRIGREAAAEIERTMRLITDPALVERVNRIGQEIAAVANSVEIPLTWGLPRKTQFQYTFKVVDDPDVNAFSLPGGFIYVNKGLLDYVQSDHELAAVLAHEIAHAAHRHLMKLGQENEKINRRVTLPALLVMVLSGAPARDLSNVMLGVQLYQIAKMSGFTQEAEVDADQAAIHYLTHTQYNPVGMLTFMERLARDEARRPERQLGIFRTHPPSRERALAMVNLFRKLGIPINRRAVARILPVELRQKTVRDKSLTEIYLDSVPIFAPADRDGMTSAERAREISARLDSLLNEGVQMYDIRLASDGRTVVARSSPILTVEPEDADLHGIGVRELAERVSNAIKRALWNEVIQRAY